MLTSWDSVDLQKAEFLWKVRETPETLRIWDLGGSGGRSMKRVARKLGRIILLHIGGVTFRSHHFDDFLIVGRPMTSKNNYS